MDRRTFLWGTGCALSLQICIPDRAGSQQLKASLRQVLLSDLDISLVRQGWGHSAQRNRRSEKNPLVIGQQEFKTGVGTVADSILRIRLGQGAERFTAWVGPDAIGKTDACIRFTVVVDGRIAARTPAMRGGSSAQQLSVDLKGAESMLLVADVAGNRTWHNYADWCDAIITLAHETSVLPVAEAYQPDMSLPEISSDRCLDPAIHMPSQVGTTPGKPFLFRIPVTGETPLTVDAIGLPSGLHLDDQHVLRGSITAAGKYSFALRARNGHGVSEKKVTIQAGDRCLALTPPMGWCSWDAFGLDINQDLIKRQTDALLDSGLAGVGYNYILIDGGWPAKRDELGRAMPNKDKFPDVKALIDYIHSLGLKVGIHTCPGINDCSGFPSGAYGHEIEDLGRFVEWGIDYLKYDWCGYDSLLPPRPKIDSFIEPYAIMGEAIRLMPRDIIYSVCQYGIKDVWKWASNPSVNANLWRISDDQINFWGSVCSNGFHADRALAQYAGPGHWNDPDILAIGKLKLANRQLGFPTPSTGLTPIEQRSQMTLWALLAAPLFISCDLLKLDSFTKDLLGNPEVIAIDQDQWGRQAQCVQDNQGIQVWARPLHDGTVGVGIFNLSPVVQTGSMHWDELKSITPHGVVLSGKQNVRDLWKRSDIGRLDGIELNVPPHGSILLKIGTPAVTPVPG